MSFRFNGIGKENDVRGHHFQSEPDLAVPCEKMTDRKKNVQVAEMTAFEGNTGNTN